MIEVRIRTEDSWPAKHLCTWPVDRLDDLIPTLMPWGVHVSGDDDYSEASGQFVVPKTGDAYFEVILHPDD